MSPPRDLSEASDKEVAAAAARGRSDGHREVVRRYLHLVHSYVNRMVHDHDLAEDLTQVTFVKAFAALESYNPGPRLSSWILKIANNYTLDYLRRQQRLRRRRLDTVLLGSTPDVTHPRMARALEFRTAVSNSPVSPLPDARALAPALPEALAWLEERRRACVIMHYMEEKSYGEIAETLDIPVGTVGTWLSRARKELRASLGPLHDALLTPSATPPPSHP